MKKSGWKLAFALYSFTILVQVQSSTDYCEICENHIACGNDGSFSPSCDAGRKIINLDRFKGLIVHKHNKYRNKFAKGAMKFKPAARMATMQWDDELAELAELNVKRCEMAHDECRNTERFSMSGQNLAWSWTSGSLSAKKAIKHGIKDWFHEYKDANQRNLDKLRFDGPVIGHFTVMVNDLNTHVGCALLIQPKDGGKESFFACNYAQTNILNRPLYIKGRPASKCIKGKNRKYPALCDVSEPIDPNEPHKLKRRRERW
ncbi:unnamed protein product [Hermetia illucens]|uniref:SCP domain-containing protein n=1 Tax=Hermetia illucens TaxID=343691 RepID=A0A7R8UMH0_HERIL|nr:antigen 5 like allergen Cul n 1-like [Hermetia illucens]CAD7083423.1 unnamed protein product [Hermetia illucens]